MAHFDEEVVKRILVEELKLDSITVTITIIGLRKLEDRLQPVLDAWIKDRTEMDFTFQGISIKDIMDKEECWFLSALGTMSMFLGDPEYIEEYRKVDFGQRFKEGNPFEHLERK